MSESQTKHDKGLKKIQKYLEKMPSLSTTVSKVLDVCNSPNTSANDLNKVVSLDPVLTGNVLKLINSAYYAMREPVTSLTKAIIMLGLNTIKNLALSTAILGNLGGKGASDSKGMEEFWSHSIATGVTAKSIASVTNVPKTDQEEYFVAGLLHDIGKIPLIRCFPNDYIKVSNFSFARNVPLHAAEKKVFGIDHSAVGKMIADKWNLLGFLHDTICFHHSPDSSDEDHLNVVRVVSLADHFSKSLEEEEINNTMPDDPILKYLLQKNKLKYHHVINLKEEILAEIENAKVFLNVTK